MIECKDLIKIYQDEENKIRIPALRGCDLSVKTGEIFSIIGPSGSGKTTLINILAGLDTCSSGEVHVGDYHLALMSKKELISFRKKMIGVVNQFPERTLFLGATVKDNLKFVSRLTQITTLDRQERTREILTKLGIDHLEHRVVRTLSGGEMIRTAIACALVKGSPLLLCDEPTGQLDSMNTFRVKDLLKQITNDFGTTVVVVTHDPRFHEGVDKTCEMRDGRVSSIIDVHEKLTYGAQRKFPLRFKMQIDSSNSIRLPDFILKSLNLTDAAELQYSKKGIVQLLHPEMLPPKEVTLDEIIFRRKELVLDLLPDDYFEQKSPIITLTNVSKTYYSAGTVIPALSDISLKIQQGGITFILGPSGSGKTTLLKILAGLESITSGQLEIFDQPFSDMSDANRAVFRRENIGLVTQQGNLHPFLTITESFLLKDILSGKNIRHMDEEKIVTQLDQFKITQRKDSYPLEISGGELQRASLAIAVNKYPKIIILDEPTANMDAELATETMQKIYNIQKTTAITFLIATHDITLVQDGYRALLLEDGQVKQDGLVITPKNN
ncbi:MAG: ATP-binding cassette domain-containing protein [Candidatus Heimdallarchaeota archaeon]|nr:ATP-binding cassette domain-containing protein [Candidatus Heimdallarchaeota archaeon]